MLVNFWDSLSRSACQDVPRMGSNIYLIKFEHQAGGGEGSAGWCHGVRREATSSVPARLHVPFAGAYLFPVGDQREPGRFFPIFNQGGNCSMKIH